MTFLTLTISTILTVMINIGSQIGTYGKCQIYCYILLIAEVSHFVNISRFLEQIQTSDDTAILLKSSLDNISNSIITIWIQLLFKHLFNFNKNITFSSEVVNSAPPGLNQQLKTNQMYQLRIYKPQLSPTYNKYGKTIKAKNHLTIHQKSLSNIKIFIKNPQNLLNQIGKSILIAHSN
ncbi:Hypothetical_protein [Hexamita inflata]|uniref:Hypothetical_protein n=1 Tax=Hexamita inflata TaxID=28002 RepID=A0AA86UE65_9EUKA|nr:Hypothetical protein HINF_LOCUS39824 [Hexamita inflata]